MSKAFEEFNEALVAENLRLRAELAAARDAALDEADARMRTICQKYTKVPAIAAELILAVRALKGPSHD